MNRSLRSIIGQAIAGLLILAADWMLYETARDHVRLRGIEINGVLRRDWLATMLAMIPVGLVALLGLYALISLFFSPGSAE
ncbi:MAG: hypothetical protein JSS72_07580 [Armatimonadetes bacterium]|nr:hypothetical protein [Armatimonadota bacterium]